MGRGKSKLVVGLLCTEMIIVCKFHDPSIIGSRETEWGSEEPPQSQIDQKSPVWIGLKHENFKIVMVLNQSAKYKFSYRTINLQHYYSTWKISKIGYLV